MCNKDGDKPCLSRPESLCPPPHHSWGRLRAAHRKPLSGSARDGSAELSEGTGPLDGQAQNVCSSCIKKKQNLLH